MKSLNYFYQHINILSLDVAGGAVVSALFFGALLKVSLPPVSLVTLALSVWIIYTIDHLRDAMTIPKVASTDRHRFHQKNFRVVLSVLFLIMLVDFILLWFLSLLLLKAGIALGALVLVYLVLQRYLKFLKELFVACLYTIGILLPSLVVLSGQMLPIHYLVIIKFFVTALMNLLLFSLFDYQEDRHHQQHSFVTWFGPRSTRVAILLLGLANIISGIAIWQFEPRLALIFIIMNISLLTLLFFGNRLMKHNYYRMLGDAVFFMPALYLL